MTDTGAPKLKLNKWWYMGGGVAVIGGVYYYRKHASSKSTTAPVDTSTIDPNTGLPYDTSGGSSGYTPIQGTTPSLYGYTDPGTGATISGGSPGSSVITGPSNNGQWAQQVEAYMVQQGFDSITVGLALGKYLTGQGLTNDQMAIVQTALAFEGNPPTAVPAPHVNPPAGQGGGTTGGTPKPSPSVDLPAPSVGTPNGHTINWTPVNGASRYHVWASGRSWKETTSTQMSVPRGATYQVAAVNSHGNVSANRSNIVRL